jgi:hypothetical protein
MGVLRTQLRIGTPTFILPRRGGGNKLQAAVCGVEVILSWILFFFVAAEAAEAPKERIAFAYASISPSMSAVWMAKEIGAFERNGLNAELVYIAPVRRRCRRWSGAAFKRRWGRAMPSLPRR